MSVESGGAIDIAVPESVDDRPQRRGRVTGGTFIFQALARCCGERD